MNKRAFKIDLVEIPRLREELRTAEGYFATDRAQRLWDLKVTERNVIQRQEDNARILETEFSHKYNNIVHKVKELKAEKLRCELVANVLERQVQEEQAQQ